MWFFLADDLLVDRVETVTPDTLQNLTAMIDALDFGSARPEPAYGETAFLDVCHRLRRLLGSEPFERFAQGMRLWGTAAGLQILNHMQPKSIGLASYKTIRRHTSGMNPCMALADAANGGSIEPSEFHRPDVQTLCRYANNVVCWSNDIQSLSVEIRQPGQFINMVIDRAAEGHSLQESIAYTASRVKSEMGRFVELCKTMTPGAAMSYDGWTQVLDERLSGLG